MEAASDRPIIFILLGVEHRGGYCERAGALRDMVQDHLCLVAMEPPASFAADSLRDRKMDFMRALRPIPEDAVADPGGRPLVGDGGHRDRDPRTRAHGSPVRTFRLPRRGGLCPSVALGHATGLRRSPKWGWLIVDTSDRSTRAGRLALRERR